MLVVPLHGKHTLIQRRSKCAKQPGPYLHGVSRSGLVSHHADLVGLRANEVNSMIIADVHKSGIFR